MKKIVLTPILILAGHFFWGQPLYATDRGSQIAVVVGGRAITYRDIEQRTDMMLVLSGMTRDDPQSAAFRRELWGQAKSALIDELKRLWICRDVDCSPSEIDTAVRQFAKDRNLTLEALNTLLQSNGASLSSLMNRMKALIKWSKAVEGMATNVLLSDKEIDQKMNAYTNDRTKKRYHVFEIMIRSAPDARKTIDGIYTQLQRRVPFKALASQLSQSPSAARGGDLGLLTEEQLDPVVRPSITSTSARCFSSPIQISDGWVIFWIREIQEPGQPLLEEMEFDILRAVLRAPLNLDDERVLSDFQKTASCADAKRKAADLQIHVREENHISGDLLADFSPELLKRTERDGWVETAQGDNMMWERVCRRVIKLKSMTRKEMTQLLRSKRIDDQARRLFKRIEIAVPVDDKTINDCQQ